MRLSALAALTALAIACATTGSPNSNERRDQARCQTIELYQTGLSPSRPYRVLGPVSGDDERAVREQACQIGGQAIIDLRRETPSVSATVGGEQHATVSGSAIVFTDNPDGGT
jgi:hypothetical protein